jgi:hypothetical protein
METGSYYTVRKVVALRKAFPAAFMLALLFLALVGEQHVKLGKANPFYEERRTDPPIISIHSPINGTCVNNVLLNFTVTKPEWWVSTPGSLGYAQTLSSVSYEIDGEAYGANGFDSTLTSPFNYFVYLANLTDGAHSLAVHAYATGFVVEIHGLWDYYVPINSSSTVRFALDSTLPSVSILSLENKTYYSTNVTLAFAVNEPTSGMSYCLDGANVTVAGNTTIAELSYGAHNLTVYAVDVAGNIGASETVYFTIAELEPEPEPFPVAPVAAASAATIAVVGVGLLVYFRKRKH